MKIPGIATLAAYNDIVVSLPETEFRTIQGRKIHFQSRGEGESLVFLHGMAASSYSFRDLIPLLVDGFRTITIDLNGFGFSERGSEPESYRLERQAEAVKELLENLGIERASLFGHSLGCAVSVLFANRFPDRVNRIVLVSPVSKFEKPPWYFRNGLSLRLFYLATRLLLSRPEKFRELMGRAFYRTGVLTGEIAEEYRRQLLIEGLRSAFFGYAVALSRESALGDEYARLAAPVRIIGGERDEIVSSDSLQELAELIPSGELSLLPDCGHSAPEEFPRKVSDLVRDFLCIERIEASQG